jgi:RsiW-degrading membrane proteinase PrsW (M82 family)
MLTTDPKVLVLALLGGVIPSFIWLWFWLKEDAQKPEPRGVLAMCFIMGMVSVIIVLPIEKLIQGGISSHIGQIIGWAGVEEIIKYLAVLIIVSKTKFLDEPIDWPIFLITSALGFAALENALFLIKPLALEQSTVSLLTGQLRFLGSTLLHAVSSGIIGISLGLSFFMDKQKQKSYLIIGLILAITLHTLFNFFIMKNNGSDFIKVFAFLWVATIINMLLLEKLRRMSGEINTA